MRIFLSLIICILFFQARAQFAPPVGYTGTTAIAADSSCILEWASRCTIERGWINCADTTLGKTTVGDSAKALGIAAEGGVVSLGDGGTALLSFPHGITNGPGADFAVFENAFNDGFIELAFVSVSSDGIHFIPFPCSYHGDTLNQIDNAGFIDARNLNNLASKYQSGYGTPFDLNELKDSIGIDINHITHIKITDAIGSLDLRFRTYDSEGNPVNDPWPTPYPSGGFDLDAVGVIHPDYPSGLSNILHQKNYLRNPVSINQEINLNQLSYFWQWIKLDGSALSPFQKGTIQTPDVQGIYFLMIQENDILYFQKVLVTQ